MTWRPASRWPTAPSTVSRRASGPRTFRRRIAPPGRFARARSGSIRITSTIRARPLAGSRPRGSAAIWAAMPSTATSRRRRCGWDCENCGMRNADCGIPQAASRGVDIPFRAPQSEFRIGNLMREAFIGAALRTPVGRHGGSLASIRADDLAAIPIKAVVERSGIDPATIDDVIFGCATQAGADNRNVARMALLLAGLPIEVPGQTVNRLCGSGLQAVASAAQAIKSGEGETFIAGGVESMTRAPYVMLKSGEPWSRKAPETADTTVGWRFT